MSEGHGLGSMPPFPEIWAAIDRRAPDIRPVIRPDIRPVIRSGIRSVIRPDIWPGIRPVIRSGIRSVIRPVIWPGVRSGIWSDIRSSVGPDVRPGPIAVAPDPTVGSPAHLLRRSCLRSGIDLCLQIGGSEDQENSQSENIHVKHLKLLNDSLRLGRPPRSATKTIQSRKGHSFRSCRKKSAPAAIHRRAPDPILILRSPGVIPHGLGTAVNGFPPFCVPTVCELSQTGPTRKILRGRTTSHKCQRRIHLRH